MAVKAIPDGLHSVTPYLAVPGVAKLIEFLKAAFGADEVYCQRRPDGGIMHAQVRIGDSIVMMGEPQGESTPRTGTLYVYVPDTDAVYARDLAAGGASIRAPADQIYGDRTAGVADPCGNQWWLATHKEDVSAEELMRRVDPATKHKAGT